MSVDARRRTVPLARHLHCHQLRPDLRLRDLARRVVLQLALRSVNSSGAAGCATNTTRPLTPSLELSKEGLAVDATQEEWRPIPGYEGCYEVSSIGRVRSLPRWRSVGSGRRLCPPEIRLLKPYQDRNGYLRVGLSGPQTSRSTPIHRLVLSAFVGPCPPGMQACHRNDIPDDNRIENLRWDTASANTFDKIANGNHYQSAQTHCKHGHEFTPENTMLHARGRGRRCRACMHAQSKARWRAKAEKNGIPPMGTKPRCKRGHEFTAENTYLAPGSTVRQCRECRRMHSRNYEQTRPSRRSA